MFGFQGSVLKKNALITIFRLVQFKMLHIITGCTKMIAFMENDVVFFDPNDELGKLHDMNE